MKRKPTPGPWAFELRLPTGSADGNYVVYNPDSDNGDVLAIVDPDNITFDLGQSPTDNARLMAAAPELYDACKALVELLDSRFLVRNTEHDHEPDWAIKQLEPIMKLALLPKAIAKAEGRNL